MELINIANGNTKMIKITFTCYTRKLEKYTPMRNPTPKLFSVVSILVMIFIVEQACKKNVGTQPSEAVSFNVINAIPSTYVNGILPVFNGLDSPYTYSVIGSIYYPGNAEYTVAGGINNLYFANGYDTTTIQLKNKLFSGNFTLKVGNIYSLFLGGDTTSLDTLLTQDNIPYFPYSGDSLAGIRIVNLSAGSSGYNITITGNPYSQKEFSNITYKGVTSFKSYAATHAVSNQNGGNNYTFTLYDNMGDSLTTFQWYYTVFRSNTIVISGSPSSSAIYPLNFLQVNNY